MGWDAPPAHYDGDLVGAYLLRLEAKRSEEQALAQQAAR